MFVKTLDMKYYNNLDKIIREKNTKAEWVAYKMSVSTVSVRNWCKGSVKMTKATVIVLGLLLEVDPYDIYNKYDYEL